MAYGRPANVRSHRRGGPRRRLNVAPWIVVSMVVVLVAAGLTAGYVWLIRQSCTGEVRATVVASPETAPILEGLSREWATGEPSVDGVCAKVDITAKDSADIAVALQNPWDARTSGPAPDAWVPQSTAWVRKAAVDADAERMMPDLQPSIARSPTVIAMPKPMAEKLGWPNAQLAWQDVINRFADNPQGWSAFGQPGWGQFRFGMTDPARSTAGLLALTAIIDEDDDEDVGPEDQQRLVKLKRVMRVYAERTEEILNEYARLAAQDPEAGLKYISAFPALEQDVLDHNLRNPKAPLVAIYPNNGSIEADHPFLVLQRAEWVRRDAQQVATLFMQFVRGSTGEARLLNAGFRDPNRVPGKDLTVNNGLTPQITALPRAVLLPESVARAVNTWTALTRTANVLLVIDVSGSMKDQVAGAGRTRMDMAKRAALDALAVFPDEARVGLWEFSSGLAGARDYRTVVPLGALNDNVDGESRRTRLSNGISRLQPRGDTGLYDTAVAAQKAMLDNFDPKAANLVVLLSDGKNDDPTGGLNADQMRAQLQAASTDQAKRVPIVTVAYGELADFAAMQEISRVTGGFAYESRESFDINQVLQAAIFGDL